MSRYLFLVFILFSSCSNTNQYSNNLIEQKEVRFKNIQQLTFTGENAEAYFSSDDKKLIFQAHDGDSLCDQIYIMDLKTKNISIVSTGNGVTTCSFFEYPNNENFIYASTHELSEMCPPKPDFSKGYVWKLYPGFDIFKSSIISKDIIRLTDSKGYDAEATYSFDGESIIYTSMKSGDLDIWKMNSNGDNKTQLTSRLGYDGGAFFNHNNSKIVWRAYYPESEKEIFEYKNLLKDNSIRPMALQLWTMNNDGSNKKQITNNNSANFGPFFLPSNNRIIFSSNMHDKKGRDFDLYLIDTNGENLERITYFDGFDGFPMFSNNGKYLVFSSNRNQAKKGDTNIFLCEWVY